jgi:hypothetical protein
MCLDSSLQKRKEFSIGDIFHGATRSDLPYPSFYEPIVFYGARRPAGIFSFFELIQGSFFSMKTLVTPQRETEHRTWVSIISTVQRVRSYLHSLSALQGATTYKEVRIYKVARYALPKTRQSFHFQIQRGDSYEE